MIELAAIRDGVVAWRGGGGGGRGCGPGLIPFGLMAFGFGLLHGPFCFETLHILGLYRSEALGTWNEVLIYKLSASTNAGADEEAY
jgi:hypothetical protein